MAPSVDACAEGDGDREVEPTDHDLGDGAGRAVSTHPKWSTDAIDDLDVVRALTDAAEEWLEARGAERVNGPFSPTINHECGLMVEGFTAGQMILMPWHPAYLGRHLDALGYEVVRDVAAGEAIFIDMDGQFYSQQCAPKATLNPCIFEFVYLARPDSVMDGISVYEARLRMGESLAEKIKRQHGNLDIDVVIPIPDSSRPAAMQLSKHLDLPYREGFIKNRYIGRTFIMPGQAVRRKSVRQKLNAIDMEFKGKNVLIVDDSIVRGTTSSEIVQMARDSGARKVYFASAAPPVRFPNVYGIDMPTREELIASDRDDDEIAREIGADQLIYQDLAALIDDVRSVNPAVAGFEDSCFSGSYITGDVTQAYLDGVEAQRRDSAKQERSAASQLDLNLEVVD